jgi:hypothetical protein
MALMNHQSSSLAATQSSAAEQRSARIMVVSFFWLTSCPWPAENRRSAGFGPSCQFQNTFSPRHKKAGVSDGKPASNPMLRLKT